MAVVVVLMGGTLTLGGRALGVRCGGGDALPWCQWWCPAGEWPELNFFRMVASKQLPERSTASCRLGSSQRKKR